MKRTKRPQFLCRLMLLSLFLPIFITFGYIVYEYLVYELITNESDLFWQSKYQFIDTPLIDIPELGSVLFLIIIFPFLLGIWLFWSGKWRLPVLVGGTVYFGLILLGSFGYWETYAPPEKRVIEWENGNNSHDIYCNGVYLGQMPLKISVEELVAKVPEWTTPPEQYFYSGNVDPVYTWFPWDEFRKERFQERKAMIAQEKQSMTFDEQKKQLAQFEAGCRYWWRLENNKSRILIRRIDYSSYFHRKPFEKILGYSIPGMCVGSLSDSTHARILVNVLGKLTESEKQDWDRHVLKHWQLLSAILTTVLAGEDKKYRLKNPDDPHIKLFETAFDSTARLRYGLSDPPTEEECRQLLANWVEESALRQTQPDRRPFTLRWNIGLQGYDSNPIQPSSEVFNGEEPLIDAAIRLMGEAIRKPLAEQWKTNYYRGDYGWAPLLYLARTNHDPEYFNDFARYYATSYSGRLELLENHNEQVIPLFKTFLYRKPVQELIIRDYARYSGIINFYRSVDNPVLEPVFREYIVYALSDVSDPKIPDNIRTDLNESVIAAIFDRIDRKNIDKNELAVWIDSLPLRQQAKDSLIRAIRWKSGEVKPLSEFLTEATGNSIVIRTEMTVDDVTRWFAEHPNATLNEFFKTFGKEFSISSATETRRTSIQNRLAIPDSIGTTGNIGSEIDLNWYLVWALLKINTPETQKTLKQLNNNRVDHPLVLKAIWKYFELGTINRVSDVHDRHTAEVTYLNIANLYAFFGELPDFVLEIIEANNEPNNELNDLSWASILALCPSPKAEQILEKWTHTQDATQKQILLSYLKNWRKRKELQERNKEFFQNLVKEKIMPDDLLIPPTPWVWQDGQYVQLQAL